MEIFQLIQFQAVAELEHMTRAAERLNLAQPALSRTIQNLENELGAPLFDRSGRRIKLNDNGRILLRYSRSILASIQDAKNEIAAQQTGAEKSIRLCVHAATALIPPLLADFRQQHPDIRFELVQWMFRQTENPEYDLLIDSLAGDEPLPRNARVLLQEDVLLAVPADHPLTRKKKVTIADIRELPFVSLHRDRSWARIVQLACGKANFAPNIVAESDNPISLYDLIRCGVGVCFLPSRTSVAAEELVLVPVADFTYTRSMYLQWNYNEFLPPAVEAFRDFSADWFAKLGEGWN